MRQGWIAGIVTILTFFVALGAARAQDMSISAPPVRSVVDHNGVDLAVGAFTLTASELVIGQPGAGGLSYERSFFQGGWRHSYIGTLHLVGSSYVVSIGGVSESFTLSNGAFVNSQGNGSTLSFNSGAQLYTYTSSNGAVAVFDKALAVSKPSASEGLITSLTYPDGQKVTFTYKSVFLSTYYARRLQAVTNNLGYMLKFQYASNTAALPADEAAWIRLTKVTGINNAFFYCAPAADSCAGIPSTWPSVTYATPADNSSARTATDILGRVTRYTYSSAKLVGIRRPSSSTDNIVITYNGTTGKVASVSNGVGTWTYAPVVSGGTIATTVTDPLSHQRVITTSGDLLVSVRDALNRTTSYGQDSHGRLTQVTQPEGDYVIFSYDSRGNVTQVTRVAKAGSGLANIVTSANYDAVCSNPVTCNSPNSTVDERGGQTDYTYDATHGGLLTATRPAPTVGAVRPQVRYSYSPLYAWYLNSGGATVQAASAVYRLTGASACASSSACSGAAEEAKTTITYGSSGVANNLLPTTLTRQSGDGALSAVSAAGYDTLGNLLTVDGPIAGSADTVRYRYDAARQLIGVVGPDPDGAGTLKHRAARIIYNPDGRTIKIQRGTVNSQSDSDWTSFAVLEEHASAYDTLGRKVKETLATPGSFGIRALTQYSYDNANRLDCTVVRMNPNQFNIPPASACTLGVLSGNGPDRITRNVYDAADQLTSVTTAYGTAVARTEAIFTYTSNGQLKTQLDAKGGLTTFEYDGFDRLSKLRYPLPSTLGSSTTDYEQYTYDAASNLTQDRRRDGTTITYGYDALNRQTSGLNGATYAYDNLDRPTSAVLSGQSTTLAWDALGRPVSETGPLGTVSWQHDLAGRRTRLTWPDGLYVTYDYNVADDLTAIRENGAASGAGVLATFAWDNLGRRTSLTRGNGVVTSYGYDPVSRLSSLAHNLTGTTADQTLTYTYNPASEIRTRAGTNAAYDPAPPAAFTRSYTADRLNRQTSAGGVSLSYDGRGNLTGDGVRTYGYDAADRLISVTGSSLGYDAFDRLAQATTGSATTSYLYDGADRIGEYAGGTLQRRYVHGPGLDEPLVWYEGSGTSDRRWLAADHLGSVISVSDGAGASLAVNTYDEYGVPGVSNLGRFQYTGQAWLPEAGLYHYKLRVYHPTLGRFLQTDPIGYRGGLNLYAYVGNDPVNWRDPWGLNKDVGVYTDLTDDGGPLVSTLNVPMPLRNGPTPPITHIRLGNHRWGGNAGSTTSGSSGWVGDYVDPACPECASGIIGGPTEQEALMGPIYRLPYSDNQLTRVAGTFGPNKYCRAAAIQCTNNAPNTADFEFHNSCWRAEHACKEEMDAARLRPKNTVTVVIFRDGTKVIYSNGRTAVLPGTKQPATPRGSTLGDVIRGLFPR